MVYKAVDSGKIVGNAIPDSSVSTARSFSNPRNLAISGLSLGALLAVALSPRRLAQAQGVAKPGIGGGAAGGSRLLGSEAAAGPARSVAPHRDPVSDRDRLSAVQLHRPRRQSGRLQCRSGAAALRRDQGHLHHPDAALRDAARCDRQQSRRRHHRFACGDAAVARPASISPIPITGRRRGSCRGATP